MSGVGGDDGLIRFDSSGRFLYVLKQKPPAADLVRIDVSTGAPAVQQALSPADPAGVLRVIRADVTPDGRSYAYSYARALGVLYLVEGLR